MSYKFKSMIVGIVSILAVLLLYFGVNYFKGENVFNNGRVFYAYYENIAGLTEGSSVTVKGYKIGTVTQIHFDKDRNNQLKVHLTVENDIEIPSNSVAKIVSLDLMGTKGISIVLGDNQDNLNSNVELSSDIEVSLQDEVNAQILPLKTKTEQLIGSIDSVMIVITSVLNKDARSSLSKSLVSLDNTFSTLSSTMLVIDKMVNSNQENINSILLNLSTISTNLNQSNEEVRSIISNFSSISDNLSKADIAATLDKIDKISDKINNSQGSLGKLINDKELYENLTSASEELDALLSDIKHHPKRYVNFSILGGGTNKPYVGPKSE